MKAIRLLGLLSVTMAMPLVYAGGPDVPSQIHFTKHALSLRAFDQLNVSGYFDVVIKGLRPGARPSASVATYSVEPLQVRIVHHTLYVKGPWQRPLPSLKKRPVLIVRINSLKKITVAGPTNVTARNLRGQGVDIYASGFGKINLLGVLNIDHIKQSGSNQITVRWVKSDTVYINSTGAGSIRLAGTARALYARVLGHSTLHAAYLRTHYVQVQATDQAVAYVCPVDTLRAFASNFGNIYYYKYPKNMTLDTEQSGNVLQMAWHN